MVAGGQKKKLLISRRGAMVQVPCCYHSHRLAGVSVSAPSTMTGVGLKRAGRLAPGHIFQPHASGVTACVLKNMCVGN